MRPATGRPALIPRAGRLRASVSPTGHETEDRPEDGRGRRHYPVKVPGHHGVVWGDSPRDS